MANSLTGVDFARCWITWSIFPLSRRPGLMCEYTGSLKDPQRHVDIQLTEAEITEAVKKLMASTELHDKLWDNGNYLKAGLKKLGFDIGNSETPITPVIIGDEKETQAFSTRLKEEGVYVKSIVFPTVPKGTGRVRNMPTAAHTKEMLDDALAAFEKVGKEIGIIK